MSVGGFLVHPTDRLPVPGCKQTNKIKYKNVKYKKKASAAPCTLSVHASVCSETIRPGKSQGKKKKKANR